MSCSDLTRRRFLGATLGAAAFVAFPGLVLAQDLDAARAAGYLGERPDGYLGQRDPNAPSWAVDLMNSINEQRRLKYAELAMKNGTTVEAVQVVAGEKVIESLAPGSYYMDASGAWVQK